MCKAPGAADCQNDVIAFMETPANHSPEPEGVKRIDTHGAMIFLAGEFAYKIKRAVRLPYLDFSTLNRRLKAMQREYELNIRTAPGLYLRISPIIRSADGTLSWEGEGEIVEYVLVMRRFEQSQLFDEMAVEGKLGEELMGPLANRIVAAQACAEVHRDIDAAGSFETIVANVTAALSSPESPVSPEEAAEYRNIALKAIREAAPLMKLRTQQGFVRRCHGDLHLRNIVLLDGEPTLFDALEFDETLAIIDVLYGVAFLLMDLYRRGLRRHACSLFNQYLQSQDGVRHLDGLALLPLFLSCRAAIRAMVTLDRKKALTPSQASTVDDDVRQYFRLAREFLAPVRQRLVAVGGLSGTGKTTLARMLAPELHPVPGALHLRSDVERKIMYEQDPQAPLPEDAYSPEITAHVYQRLYDKAERTLRAGHSVVVDAVFATEGERRDVEQCARNAGTGFEGLWLTAPINVLCARVAAREGDASDADVQVVRQQLSYEVGAIDWQTIDCDATPAEVHARAAAALGLRPGHSES